MSTRKTVIITGASNGIGRETALLLSARGARVVLAARRAERLDALVTRIKAEGGQCLAVITDVTSASSVQNLVDEALAHFGQVDVLINNAGLMAISPLAERKISEWERMIDINIKGVLYGIAAVLPIFELQQHGHVINITSPRLPGITLAPERLSTAPANSPCAPSARGCARKRTRFAAP